MRSRDPQLPKDPVLLIPWALPTKSEVLKLTASVKTERVDPSVQPPQPSPKRIAPSENVPPPPKRRKLSPEPCIDLSQARVKQEQKPEVKSFLEELKNVSAICHSAILLDCLLSYYSRNQPDIKVKVKNEMCMEELVYDRLHRNDIKNLKLELSLHMRTFTVTRKWMTGHLGGGMQTMVSKIAPEKTAKHGYDHFMYVNLASNLQVGWSTVQLSSNLLVLLYLSLFLQASKCRPLTQFATPCSTHLSRKPSRSPFDSISQQTPFRTPPRCHQPLIRQCLLLVLLRDERRIYLCC